MPVSFKLTDAERDLVDSLRGETGRSVWLREMAIKSAEQMQDSRIRESLGVKIVTDDRQPPGIVSVVSRGEDKTEVRSFTPGPDLSDWDSPEDAAYDEPAPKPKNCKHPKVHVKGTCPDCYVYVGSKP